MSCKAPRSAPVIFPSMADTISFEKDVLSLSSLVVGEKTLWTSELEGLHPGGGILFAAAQAVTAELSNASLLSKTETHTRPTLHLPSQAPPLTVLLIFSSQHRRPRAHSYCHHEG